LKFLLETVTYNVTIFPYPTEMAIRCHVIKEFGQYELLNVSVEQNQINQ